MSLTGILFILAVALALVGVLYFSHWADRKRVARLIRQQGGTILNIERSFSVGRAVVSERNTTFWQVRYRARDGTVRVAKVFASFLRCRIYQDEADPPA